MAAELCLAKECVWYDKSKYEQAETRYQEIVASRHAGLTIEGKAMATASEVSTKLQEAQAMIAKTLQSASGGSGLEARVAQLESEARSLKSTLETVLTRLAVLEGKASGAAQPSQTPQAPGKTEKGGEDEDDDFDLFGSDEEEDEEAEKVKQECVAAYTDKKSLKKPVIAKSGIVLEVKPWDDETDMKEIEKHVRSIVADGLVWGGSKLVPVGYGIMKLQISCVVEDDKIGTDFLEEKIMANEDLVQSVDIAAFNKI